MEGRRYDDADDEIYCTPEITGIYNWPELIAKMQEEMRRKKRLEDDPVDDGGSFTDDDMRDNPRNGDWLQKPSSEIFRFHRDHTTTDEKMDEKMRILLSTLQITSGPDFPNVLRHLEHIKEDDVFCLRLGSGDTPDYIHWLNDSLISTMMSEFTKTSKEIDNVVVYDPQFLAKCTTDAVPWKHKQHACTNPSEGFYYG